MAGRPRRACRRCNTQKVRCNGLRPVCARCERLGVSCVYEDSQWPVLREGQEFASEALVSTPMPTASWVPQTDFCGIPFGLVGELVNIYFSHVYNARLLLDEEAFTEEVRLRMVEPQILLSVCAFASKFYRDESGHRVLLDAGLGHEWANSSASIAAAQLGTPREENIATFLNLTLYWYSEGEWQRSFIYKWNGIQIAYVLGIPAGGPSTTARTRQAELRRRRLWACVCMMMFGSKADFIVGNIPSILERIPLPGVYEHQVARALSEPEPYNADSHLCAIYAALIHILSLWNEVYQLTKSADVKLDTLQSLHSKLEDWKVKISERSDLAVLSVEDVNTQNGPLLTLIHIIYDQCLCALHSSIVPLFSWGKPAGGLDYARQISAQVAYEHAYSISTWLRTLLQSSLPMGRVPSFVGYAAYSSCAIQVPFLWCTNTEVRACARANVIENLRCIQEMGRYWKFISLLGINIQKLYMMHEVAQTRLEHEPKYLSQERLLQSPKENERALASILSHNEIVWKKSGGMAQRDAQITDLDDSLVEGDIRPPRKENISSFIDKLSQSDLVSDQNTVAFPCDFDPEFGERAPVSPGSLYLISDEQLTSFDNWVAELGTEVDNQN